MLRKACSSQKKNYPALTLSHKISASNHSFASFTLDMPSLSLCPLIIMLNTSSVYVAAFPFCTPCFPLIYKFEHHENGTQNGRLRSTAFLVGYSINLCWHFIYSIFKSNLPRSKKWVLTKNVVFPTQCFSYRCLFSPDWFLTVVEKPCSWKGLVIRSGI